MRFGEAHRVQNVSLTARRTVSQSHVLSLKLAQWREASRTAESGLTQSEFTADPFALPLAQDSRFDVDRIVAHLTHVSALSRLLLHTSTYVSHTNRASWRQAGESGERFGTGDYADDFNCASSATSYRECGNQGRPRTYTVMGFEPRLELLLGSQQRGVHWWTVIHPSGYGVRGRGTAMFSLFTTAVHTSALAALLTFASTP